MQNEFKFRPSSLGNLMANQQGKKDTKSIEELGETAKAELLELWINKKYGRYKNVTNQYMEKGTLVEEDSLDLYSLVTKTLYVKNKNTYENEFFKGTPDIVTDDCIIDIKSSWDIFTFYGNLVKPINKTYIYQLNAYMDLTGLKKAKLVYTLVNTPYHLLEDLKKKLRWKLGVIDEDSNPEYLKGVAEIEKNCIFDDIDIGKRYIEFEFDYDAELMEGVKKRVPIWREFINLLK
jgi:hypothetical protein